MRASKPHPADTLAAGQRIGPFILLAPIGAGGSGRIWAVARMGQLGFSKRMVLKVMRHDKLSNERARARFEREACLGGRLSHPNVRAVHDLGSHEGRPFMALSWVDASLEELLEHAPDHVLDADVVCWIAMQCCAALGAAHEHVDHGGVARPIVHRDVSPGNILLTVAGHALLADLASAESSPRAEAGARFFGSLGYAAPEALRQEACDARTDLFSLGAVLFEALAGEPAFGGDDERSVMFQILEGTPPDLARRAPGAPADLAAIVQRCLARRAEDRFQSARELHGALSRCAGQRSAFQLERRTASLVRDVLGARIREREEALHLAYQRVALSPIEQTDTLPIQGVVGATPGQGAPDAPGPPLIPEPSRAGPDRAISPRPARARRVVPWAAAALVLLAILGTLASRWRRVSPTAPASAVIEAAPRPAPTTAPGAVPPQTHAARPPPSNEPLPVSPGGATPAVESKALRPEPNTRAPGTAPPRRLSRQRSTNPRVGSRQGGAVEPKRAGERSAQPSRALERSAPAGAEPRRRLRLELDRESPYSRRQRAAGGRDDPAASKP